MTADGALYVDWARDVLAAAERMQLATTALQSARSGHARLAASMTVSEYLVPRWLRQFRHEHPAVQVNLSVLNSEQVAEQVHAGRHDVGFIETTQPVRDLHTATVRYDELLVVVASSAPWTRGANPCRRPSWQRRRWFTARRVPGTTPLCGSLRWPGPHLPCSAS